MRPYGNDIRYYMRWISGSALVAGFLAAATAPLPVPAGVWDDVRPRGGTTLRERAKAARTKAVESARIELEKARASGAERAAPYEYSLAEGYFRLAIEELNEGDLSGVESFAAESRKYSVMAMEKSMVDSL